MMPEYKISIEIQPDSKQLVELDSLEKYSYI